MHDPLSLTDLVTDELRQRRESGADVDFLAPVSAAIEEGDDDRASELLSALAAAPRRPDWPFVEADDAAPLADVPDEPPVPTPALDRYLGAWLGRIAGCMLGKPFEEGRRWTPSAIEEYLRIAGAFPLRDYVPVLDPMHERFVLRESWPRTTRGRVQGGDRDDDIDYTILGLLLLERHGRALDTAHVAEAWLAHLPFTRTYTAERAAYRNLVSGVDPSRAADVRNPYREWIGALIRADVFGWVDPGRPFAAARAAERDALLSHRGNGVWAARWAAALASSALVETDARAVVARAHAVLPPGSRIERAVAHVRERHDRSASWSETLSELRAVHEQYEWVHAVNNAALIAAGLLWSEGDFAGAIGRTVEGGWDTDSNAATVGAVMGAILGASVLPSRFVKPLGDTVRSAVFGCDSSSISDLAQRTRALAERLSLG